MISNSAPGVYFNAVQPVTLDRDLVRTDIAGFIGYSQKGPLHFPVRIESWRQFLEVFGYAEHGYLAYSVKAFFENGGVQCYVLRVTDDQSVAANAELSTLSGEHYWQIEASFPFSDAGTPLGSALFHQQVSSLLANNINSPVIENSNPNHIAGYLPNPGAWGNLVSVTLERSPLLSTKVIAVLDEGHSLLVESTVGLEKFSIIEISQLQEDDAGVVNIVQRRFIAESIDTATQVIHLPKALNQSGSLGEPVFDPVLPIVLETIEYDLDIYYESRLQESFAGLGIHPEHSKSLHKSVSEVGRWVSLRFNSDTEIGGSNSIDWCSTQFWPIEVASLALQYGKNGLRNLSAEHFKSAINSLALIDEVSIVAAPDLVFSETLTRSASSIYLPQVHDCAALLAPDAGWILGRVSDGEVNLANVNVTDAESGLSVKTSANGEFHFDSLPLSLRTLRIEKQGFRDLEIQVFSKRLRPDEPEDIHLEALSSPNRLSDGEILDVQRALANPYVLGTYRIAIIDPPRAEMKTDELRLWRAKIGDSACAAMYFPWVERPEFEAFSTNSLSQVPPSGYVAGTMAKLDLLEGPQRAAANTNLRFCKALTSNVTPTLHGILNQAGINVLRSVAGQGIRILGARTLSSDPQWQYSNVRRFMLALEKTLDISLQWVVFESQTPVLRQAIIQQVRSLLTLLWRSGALAGDSEDAAFQIKCDFDNNPQDIRDKGQLKIEIAVAPSVPFEFIRISLGKTLDAMEVTEA